MPSSKSPPEPSASTSDLGQREEQRPPARELYLLEGAPELPCLLNAFGGPSRKVPRESDPAAAMREGWPGLIVIDPAVDWHRAFVSALPPEQRPAVLAVGAALAEVGVADEWMVPERDQAEARSRLTLARQRARARRQTARRAFVDFLTGLPNRRASVRALVREAERARRSGGHLSLVLIDLDDFKRVNDTQGHPAGDRLLRRVGAVLRSVTRGSELCGRVGGDEFALVIAGRLAVAKRAAHRAKEALAAMGVSASMAACELLLTERLRDLYRRADRELKGKKERRRTAWGAKPGSVQPRV